MAAFSGQLRSNEIFSALYNMIISQEVFADNLGEHQTLVDKARVDGSMYGDTKLYYSTDVLKSAPWGNDAEAINLLKLHRPQPPKCQAIHLDKFRQICLTVDNYLTKRAWADEGTFSSFNSAMLGWMRETKRVHDGTLYNVFIGTTKSAKSAQNREIDLRGARANASTEEEANRLEVEALAQGIADLLVEMGDYSRDFNDNGFLRSYANESIKVIWNHKFVNLVRKVDLPTIFHKEGLVDKFDQDIMPARYFGNPNAAQVAAASNDGSYRSVIETEYEVASAAADPRAILNPDDNKYYVHVFPGDLIPSGVIIAKGEGYTEDADVICKVLVKLPPFMSAFEVGTSFFNAKSLTENHYLTFGFNTLEYLENYPFITVKSKAAN